MAFEPTYSLYCHQMGHSIFFPNIPVMARTYEINNSRSPLTVQQILDSRPDALVEGACVRRRLESQSEFLVTGFPVVKSWHYFVVLKIFFYGAT